MYNDANSMSSESERGVSDDYRTLATISADVSATFFADADIDELRARRPSSVHDELTHLINTELAIQNARIKDDTDSLRGPVIPPIRGLNFPEVGQLVARLYSIVKIAPSNKNADPDLYQLAAYDDDPASEHWGTYRTAQTHLRSIVRRYAPAMPTKGFAEVVASMEDSVPVVQRGREPHLIAVRNGIVDQHDRDANGVPTLKPFSPEHIFIAKLDVDWNPEAANTTIHNDADGSDWDVESWMADFFPGDAEMTELLWQIIGASVRPYTNWGKCAFFYAAKGNNGKGTLVSLMRNILGVSNYASIPMLDFGKDFLLEPLTRASAILVDENDVGAFVERSANFKAVVTNDVITINRKHKTPIAHQHFGFMVQCLNDEPQIKDKSESFYRRQLFVKFTKSFTGAERKYIKDDYLTRPEVLEYVLKRVLTMDYDKLSEPAAVVAALNDFKLNNDPVRAFWTEFGDDPESFTWDLLPFSYLYDLYKAWFTNNYPTGKPLGFQKFTGALLAALESQGDDADWTCENPDARIRPSAMMSTPQLISVDYGLNDWINQSASKLDRRARATLTPDMLKRSYRGLRRKNVAVEVEASPMRPITAAEIVGFAEWLDRDGSAGVPPELAA